jgi:hypothetical protein
MVERVPTIRLAFNPRMISGRSSSRWYQLKVNPRQSTENFELLKEKITRIRIGRCRKKYTTIAIPSSQRGSLVDTFRPSLGFGL